MLKDLGVPNITCFIGDKRIDRALLDLGSSVNLIPYSVYEELGLGELQPTNMTLQLPNRLIKVPRGRIDDVLLQVHKGYFANHTRNETPVILDIVNYLAIGKFLRIGQSKIMIDSSLK
ncbi:putative nucleotidyltransferase, Ribonuclease H [Senna tora]|uniref:Putative nucleotidyltransferase, Ribonuclease H n=1 Tax=Senna tora TaxID=362788 RepID=A0A834XGT9_9FABA|nr:putative nucleotidyltransferase, Ribonuclease H [Senna tora]